MITLRSELFCNDYYHRHTVPHLCFYWCTMKCVKHVRWTKIQKCRIYIARHIKQLLVSGFKSWIKTNRMMRDMGILLPLLLSYCCNNQCNSNNFIHFLWFFTTTTVVFVVVLFTNQIWNRLTSTVWLQVHNPTATHDITAGKIKQGKKSDSAVMLLSRQKSLRAKQARQRIKIPVELE